MQIALIVAVAWIAHMALFLPLMLVLGRAAHRADAQALADHLELLEAEAEREAYAVERTRNRNRRAAS